MVHMFQKLNEQVSFYGLKQKYIVCEETKKHLQLHYNVHWHLYFPCIINGEKG